MNQEPYKKIHIAWQVKRDLQDTRILVLSEIAEYWYHNPNSDQFDFIKEIEIHEVNRLKDNHPEADSWNILMWADGIIHSLNS